MINIDTIRKWWDVFVGDGNFTEIRILGKFQYSGYFKSLDKLIQAIEPYAEMDNEQIYFTLNEINPDCYGRQQCEKIVKSPKTTTTDSDIVNRKTILIDFDPIRATGVNASDDEFELAHKKAQDVFKYLREQGFSDPAIAISGNGWHLQYFINDCPNNDENTEITNLVIPDGVTKIGSRAFQGCHGLTSITLPNSVTSIGDFAFSCCEGFSTITVPSNITFGEYVFSMCSGLTTAIISEGVTTIGNGMFSACKNLNSIIIPSSVSTIKQDAFNGCNNLTKVIVKDISAYCKVKYENFASNPLRYSHRIYSDEATEITDLIIPANVETIENCVFSFCSGLKSVTIPSTVKTIGIQSFEDCVGLTSLTIEDGVKTIGTYAFYNCINLTSVTIPGSANIGPAAFEDCKGLTTLNFMNGVETIGYNAFYGCTGITSVTFPSSMTSIDSRAFNDIDLLSVTSLLTEPFEIEGKESDYYKVFSSNTFENATLYVPEGTIEKYKTTKGWKDFHHIVEGIPSGINSVSTSAKATEKERYNLNGERLSKPLRGVNIIRMSDGTTKKVVVK